MVGDELNRAFPHFNPTSREELVKKWRVGVELGEAG